MRLTVLVTSPRVAAGLLSWSAWSTIASAGRRLSGSADAPFPAAVAHAGHAVEVLPDVSAPRVLEALDGRDAVWLTSEADPPELLPGLLSGQGTGAAGVEVTLLHASYDVPGARLLDLVAVMDRLRAECPWDREQTHRSLARYLLEETYETLEAIESGDPVHLREELGDLLLQVVFHAKVAAEAPAGGFTVDDVAAGIIAKLVHRHPHVFAREPGADPVTASDVEGSWERLKAVEKRRDSVLDGVPAALPALALADKVLGRASRVGVVPAPVPAPVPASVPAPAPASGAAADLGDRLMGLVVEARAAGEDPEQALRDAVRRLTDAVRATEPG